MHIILSNCLLLCISALWVKSDNILAVLPYPGRSHVVPFMPLFEALALRGHNLTVISYFPRQTNLPNYTDVDLAGNITHFKDMISIGEYDPTKRLTRYLNPINLQKITRWTCEAGLNSKGFQDFLSRDATFDIIMIEFFKGDCFLGLTKKFKASVIGLSSCTLMPWSSRRFGNPTHTGYIPNNFMSFSDQMSFFQRLENTIINVVHVIQHEYFSLEEDKLWVQKHFGMNSMELISAIFNSSLLLINTHFTLNLPRPLVPGIIEVGGIHIRESRKIPKHIQDWIDNAEHGVIYFSLGSLLKAHTLPKETCDAFLKTFARLPQRILWKWESDNMEDKPENVMIQKWMPQADIFNQENVVAFISHGGLLGTIEAVHNGVPIVVMPQFGDQHTNAKAVEASGSGVILPFDEITEEIVYEKLKTVLSDDFRQKAKELSRRFRDRPMPPLETAIYWVEYVLRYKGAPHLTTAAVNMPLYQYYLLDIFGFLTLILTLSLYIMYKISKTLTILLNTKKKIKSS